MQADHSREIREMQQRHGREIADKDTRHKQEISFLKTVIARAAAWFPYFREMLRIENLCCLVGFDERQTATFVKGKLLEYARELYSEEHKRKFTTEKTGFQVVKEPTNGTRLVLAINRKAYCRVVQRANSISYGRAYTDLYSRKGKAGE